MTKVEWVVYCLPAFPPKKLRITFFQPSPEIFWDDVTAANGGSDWSDGDYEITEFQWSSSSAPDFNVPNTFKILIFRQC